MLSTITGFAKNAVLPAIIGMAKNSAPLAGRVVQVCAWASVGQVSSWMTADILNGRKQRKEQKRIQKLVDTWHKQCRCQSEWARSLQAAQAK